MTPLPKLVKILLFSILIFAFFIKAQAQVGIGTINPDDGSAFEIESTTAAFVPPRMTTSQMNSIPTPLEGAVIFNTSFKNLFVYSNASWKNTTNPTLVLNKTGGTITTVNNTYANFPLNSTHALLPQDITTYTITGNGTITLNRSGSYLISASFSTSNLPVGNHKYIIGVYKNTALLGYLTRGFVEIPGTGSDYFGASGAMMYSFSAGDSLELKYVLNNNGSTVSSAFFNIGIS